MAAAITEAGHNPGMAIHLAILSVFDPVFTIERFHMGLALFTASGLLAPLHGAIARLIPGTFGQAHVLRTSTIQKDLVAINSISARPYPARVVAINHSDPGAARTVRVLRVVEASSPSASVGRMFISGSMADVCAELDRLAAGEATLH